MIRYTVCGLRDPDEVSSARAIRDNTHFGRLGRVTRAIRGVVHRRAGGAVRQVARASWRLGWTVKTASAPVISKTRATTGCIPAK
ncbi:hypothetical protein GCM10010327_68660 [Streptomyces nitrosporeus]|nr:hypothetical protein GCM10010327_68660 [Streptomyces nitrosporeus]